MSLTPQEQRLLDLTVELWNGFLDLPDKHPQDSVEMMHDVHDIQNRIMARVAARAHPEQFIHKGGR